MNSARRGLPPGLLRAASLRHLLRHPAQLALALLGLALGVGTVVAVQVATASAQRAFELSLRAVNGAATDEIVGGPPGIDERWYVRLRTGVLLPGAPVPPCAPLLTGYVTFGEQTLQLVGIDPFASAGLEESGGAAAARGVAGSGIAALQAWFTERGAVAMSARTAAELGLAEGARFELAIGGVRRSATLIARLGRASPGLDGVLLTDIAQAQEWLGAPGRLSRIDLRLPPDGAGAAWRARLRPLLPAGLALQGTRATARESLAMAGAFTTNLEAMSLLALLVGTLLVYGAVSFAVLQRRRIIAVLRALGATRGEVLAVLLAEGALLGLLGAACGVVLGTAIGRGLIGLVSRTINDLYFVVAVRQVTVPPGTLLAALCGGLGTALVAALIPALEAAAGAPELGLKRSVLEERAVAVAYRLVALGALLALGALVLVLASGRSLFGGFAALFMLLLGVAAVTPAALRALALAAARLAARVSPVVRLACGDIAGSLSRTGVAVAALGMALTAMIGVAVMVQSFRESLREWLGQTMRADLYVSAPGVADSLERRLDPRVIDALLAVPGVRAHSAGRRVSVASPRGPVDLDAVSLAPESHAGFIFTAGDPARAWPRFAAGAVLISEPLAWRLQLAPGDTLALTTAAGARSFTVAGVYREYGNERGEVLMSLEQYRRLWHDDAVGALGLYLAAGARPEAVAARLRDAVHGRQALLIRSNAEIRALSMRIFERTFVITRVLYWLAAGVAAVGLVSALLAWELERARSLALLRSLGVTPAGAAGLLVAQTLFMGLAALAAAIPAGLLTALTLTEVINRRAFGWRIELHLAAAQFTQALWLALAAALAAALYP
ncbi:MAG TPA: FtsX-like permease family protein, partial [Steroidobacteraceae bacterium]|nr:FtsX-like permease family protein [Steroidobacteraceae bacterium]